MALWMCLLPLRWLLQATSTYCSFLRSSSEVACITVLASVVGGCVPPVVKEYELPGKAEMCSSNPASEEG